MSQYVSKKPNSSGIIDYTPTEDQTWSTLIQRQTMIIQNRAASDFLHGLSMLELSLNKIPQLSEVNQKLHAATGWRVQEVPALIRPIDFFKMLSEKTFPAATFIRVPEELDYLEEPDIFHEIFGHCPMICHPDFAEFMMQYGQMALKAPKSHHKYYARLFWFTVEFGLIQEIEGLRCYGGGILSSIKETVFALEDARPQRNAFDLLEVLRTPYRYDQIQSQYFIIQAYADLYKLVDESLHMHIQQAIQLGDYPLLSLEEKTEPADWVTC